jgi:hypothetical protein
MKSLGLLASGDGNQRAAAIREGDPRLLELVELRLLLKTAAA